MAECNISSCCSRITRSSYYIIMFQQPACWTLVRQFYTIIVFYRYLIYLFAFSYNSRTVIPYTCRTSMPYTCRVGLPFFMKGKHVDGFWAQGYIMGGF